MENAKKFLSFSDNYNELIIQSKEEVSKYDIQKFASQAEIIFSKQKIIYELQEEKNSLKSKVIQFLFLYKNFYSWQQRRTT